MDITKLCEEANSMAREKGFWDHAPNFGEKIALIHSELSEALEEARVLGVAEDAMIYFLAEKPEKPEGIAIELADAVIRLADLCGQYSIPLKRAIEMKMAYNAGRQRLHGKQF